MAIGHPVGDNVFVFGILKSCKIAIDEQTEKN